MSMSSDWHALVLDAVENYNERWMELWQAQERKKTAETDGKVSAGRWPDKRSSCINLFYLALNVITD